MALFKLLYNVSAYVLRCKSAFKCKKGDGKNEEKEKKENRLLKGEVVGVVVVGKEGKKGEGRGNVRTFLCLISHHPPSLRLNAPRLCFRPISFNLDPSFSQSLRALYIAAPYRHII